MSESSESSKIDSTAIIDPSAKLGEGVTIGPYSVIGPDVVIGDNSWIGPHVVINGPTIIGEENKIFQFASVGEVCQDKKYKDEPTKLIIGDRNVIREGATLQRGTVQDRGETVVGSDNLLMAYVHIAHDCIVGDSNIFANNATLAGHVEVGDGVILGGFSAVHQFCKIGSYSMSGMCSAINKDMPAFVMVQGNLAKPFGLNSEGMKRRGNSKALINLIKRAYRIVYRQGLALDVAKVALETLRDEIANLHESDVEKSAMTSQLTLFIDSINQSTRGIVR